MHPVKCKSLQVQSFGFRVSTVENKGKKHILTILNSSDESTSGDWHNQTTHLPSTINIIIEGPLVWWRLFLIVGLVLGVVVADKP